MYSNTDYSIAFAGFFIVLLIISFYQIKLYIYSNSTYYKITHNSWSTVKKDLGKYGEYLIYKQLKKYEESKAKLLFNIYVPNELNTLTEIDVLMIHEKGIFVIESKNYSGWIFGNERDKKWTQVLANGDKNYFFNPILQNKIHIKCLSKYLPADIPVYSIIVFSKRCTLKKISIFSPNTSVMNRDDMIDEIERYTEKDFTTISHDKIDELYKILYPYTQLSEEEKVKHIERINQQYH